MLLPGYHMVSDAVVPHVQYLYRHRSIRQFTDDLDFFLRNYAVVDLDSLIDMHLQDKPFTRDSFFLSFDDGYRECHDVIAPILKKKGVPATFFLNPAFLDNKELFWRCKASLLVAEAQGVRTSAVPDAARLVLQKQGLRHSSVNQALLGVGFRNRGLLDEVAFHAGYDFREYLSRHRPYLTSSEVQHLIDDGFSIGTHSIDHPLFEELDLDGQVFQAVESARMLRESFPVDCRAFAFPHNDRGVGREFFERIAREGSLVLSFGSSNMRKDAVDSHLHRLFLDDNQLGAGTHVSMAYLTSVIRSVCGTDTVFRN
jgi:peptidoglycan/xylan/chitin deacetylase (PgdA/CDA1 family)